MKKLIILLILTMLILTVGVTAEEQYLTKGLFRNSAYSVDGTGLWNTDTTAQSYIGNFVDGVTPVIDDINNDGTNDIIIINGGELSVLDYDGNVLALQDSIVVTNPLIQTVGLIDYDNDNLTEIIIATQTNISVYEFNSSDQLSLQNTTAHGLTYYTTLGTPYPTIKCAVSTIWADNKDRCVMVFPINGNTYLVEYQPDTNTNTTNAVGVASTLVPMKGYSINIIDVDNDGSQEIVYGLLQRNVNPRNFRIFITDINGTGSVSTSNIYTHNNVVSGDYANSDILVTNLDGALGNGYEINFAHETSANNWEVMTIDYSGTEDVPIGGYFVTNPNGQVSRNGFLASDTTYSEDEQDPCWYLRDSSDNKDTVMCVTQKAGSNGQETDITNTNNLTNPFYIHEVNLLGGTGILTSAFYVSGTTVSNYPSITTEQYLIPVDYQINGGIDVIGVSSLLMSYYDDEVLNEQVTMSSVEVCPINNVCENSVATIKYGISDAESNTGYCTYTETYINDTSITTFANKSFLATTTSVTATYTADATGSFKIVTNCTDSYNTDNPVSKEYIIIVSNDTSTCNNYDTTNCYSENFVSTSAQTSQDDFDTALDDFYTDMGVESSGAKNILGLLVIIFTAIAIFKLSGSIEMSMGGGVVGGIIAVSLGLLSILPFVIIIILSIAFVVYKLLNRGM